MTDETREPSSQQRTDAIGVLHAAPFACLSLTDGGPYVIPICFAYEALQGGEGWGRILLHTGEGRKSRALALDPRVCLAVVADAAFDRGPEPCRDTFAFRSVIIEGAATRLEDHEEREKALRLIVAKYDPEAKERPFAEKDFRATLLYAVTIASLSYTERRARS